jgi:murein DD-endopeptidase MepM/ murein hydrolase activator NlpD
MVVLLLLLAAGFVLPERAIVPVLGATARDWHPESFWYSPWGASGVHKGIDIFAPERTPAIAAVPGIVVYRGELSAGGRVVAILGPKWRVHYYAHLTEFTQARRVRRGEVVGRVGSTGNAVGKPPHLHYSVISLVPLPWRITREAQGWKKAFYLDPVAVFGARR